MPFSSCLVDTNILLRAARRQDPQFSAVHSALTALAKQGVMLHYTHQNIAELWNVMTRPTAKNGFGLDPSDAEREVLAIESEMALLSENESSYREWRSLVFRYDIRGTQVHDARLVATMYVHGVSHILTLNSADFTRFPGIVAVHPTDI